MRNGGVQKRLRVASCSSRGGWGLVTSSMKRARNRITRAPHVNGCDPLTGFPRGGIGMFLHMYRFLTLLENEDKLVRQCDREKRKSVGGGGKAHTLIRISAGGLVCQIDGHTGMKKSEEMKGAGVRSLTKECRKGAEDRLRGAKIVHAEGGG